MITKRQYKEILEVSERYIKTIESDPISLSPDYKRGFLTAIAIVKSLTEI